MNKKNYLPIFWSALVLVAITGTSFALKKCPLTCILSLFGTKTVSQSTDSISDANSSASLITEIASKEDFEQLLKNNNPVVVKFHATWCGGCQYVATFFPALAQHFEGKASFYSINTDNKVLMKLVQDAHLTKQPIEYLPTFVFMQPGKVHEQLVGPKEFEELQTYITTVFDFSS